MKALSRRQMLALMFVAMLSPFLRLIPRQVALFAGRAAWTAPFLAFVLEFYSEEPGLWFGLLIGLCILQVTYANLSPEEQRENSRSRSAKLRVLEKL